MKVQKVVNKLDQLVRAGKIINYRIELLYDGGKEPDKIKVSVNPVPGIKIDVNQISFLCR
tara:strand:- start:10103 stop:10282 length:180 start_codon:yes stop_codon:yes gene_type:complete